MIRSLALLLLLGSLFALVGCTTVIDVDLAQGPSQLSVDGQLTDQAGVQTIRLTQTSAYFDNNSPPAVQNAAVTVSDSEGNTYPFTDPDGNGDYTWTSADTDPVGVIGRTYRLTIQYQGQTYQAMSRMNRVPTVDSLLLRRENRTATGTDQGYQAEFFARDFAGAPDYYRVQFYRNDSLDTDPQNLIVLYDGGQSSSFNTDGLLFSQFVRQDINPEGLYDEGDRVRVEIGSITAEAYDFYNLLGEQVSNGGLFATPPANVPTNIINLNSAGPKATGFFVTSAIRSRSARATAENVR